MLKTTGDVPTVGRCDGIAETATANAITLGVVTSLQKQQLMR
jgi:hypothetical protein